MISYLPSLSAAALFLCAMTTHAADAVVSDVRAQQQPGTKQVIIQYRLSGNTAPVWVGIEGSTDGGATWTLPVHQVTGHVGEGITATPHAKITWNAGLDWNGNVSDTVRFRVTASAEPPLYADMVTIPAGSFMMGSEEVTPMEGPVHSVHVSAFQLGVYEVTGALWRKVRAWGLENGYTNVPEGFAKGPRHPISQMTWFDAVKWCNARSEMEGLQPCYRVEGAVLRTGHEFPTCDWNADGYRLPTEAEWEKASRGGLAGKRFPLGDTLDHSLANYTTIVDQDYDTNPGPGPHPVWAREPVPYTSFVGVFPANGYGLRDMAGNVAEWCWDSNMPNIPYPSEPQTDPRPGGSAPFKIIRGGSWMTDASAQRNAKRRPSMPFQPAHNWGLRVARKAAP